MVAPAGYQKVALLDAVDVAVVTAVELAFSWFKVSLELLARSDLLSERRFWIWRIVG